MNKFNDFMRGKQMVNSSFLAVTTRDPDRAIAIYTKKTGFEPTVILIRPDFVPTKNHPMIVKYRYAAWGAMLVSHLISPEEITDDIESVYRNREISIDTADPKRTDFSIPVRKIGRPERVQSMCPHCHGKISDLNNLGYWYGWSFGIEPPYWQELRAFVFERDGFKCEKCGKKFPPALLQAHHRHAKEDGGEDSARNLATMCADCHAENKPIFED